MATNTPKEVQILILGAGWTSTFLIPLIKREGISYAATTTTGRDDTIKFIFDPESEDITPYKALPSAKTVLITFPLKGAGQATRITHLYWKAHAPINPNWLLLGSTGIFTKPGWNDHESEYDKTAPRAIAEDELIGMNGVVLNLAGLYGGERDPKNWIGRVAPDKQSLGQKEALHLIHGEDVARAILGVHKKFSPRDRWIVTDRHVYDWWDLADAWGDEVARKSNTAGPRRPYRKWVQELMDETNVHALPRNTENFSRRLDSRAFWRYIDTLPTHRLSR